MAAASVRRVLDGPPFTAVGLLWPWSAPWRIRSAAGTREPIPSDAGTFTVVSVNALGSNRRADAFADELVALDADVVVVVEASEVVLTALEAAGIDDRHERSFVERRPRWSGCGIWTRHPATRLEGGDAGHAYVAVRVQLPCGAVDVVAVHTRAPAKPRTGARWRRSFEVLEAVAGRLDGPVVLAGDWNATLGHHPMRRFLERTGLRDGHTAAGRGLARSWPASGWLPPLGLIDHVVVSPTIGVVSVEERGLPGSDHLAIVAALAISPTPPAPPAPG